MMATLAFNELMQHLIFLIMEIFFFLITMLAAILEKVTDIFQRTYKNLSKTERRWIMNYIV